jgi:hypothetical protein
MTKPINYRRDRGELIDIQHGIESATLPAMVDGDARDAHVMRNATESRAWRSSATPAHVARAFVGLPLAEFFAALNE